MSNPALATPAMDQPDGAASTSVTVNVVVNQQLSTKQVAQNRLRDLILGKVKASKLTHDSIPSIIRECMELCFDVSELTGREKKQLIIFTMKEFVESTDFADGLKDSIIGIITIMGPMIVDEIADAAKGKFNIVGGKTTTTTTTTVETVEKPGVCCTLM